MIVIDVNIDEVIAFTAKLDRAPQVIAKHTNLAMHKSLSALEQPIATGTPVNTGALRGSETTEVRGRGAEIMGRIFTPLAYGAAVEHGRKPGKMPSVDAIQYWVERKGIAGDEDPRQVAFLIARAIGRRGTKGAHMFEEGLKTALPHILRLWRVAGHDIITELVS